MENINYTGSDNLHLDLLKKIIELLKSKYKIEVIVDSNISKEIIGFFSDAKLSDKIYYFFPKNILKVNQNNIFYVIDCFLDYGYFAGSHGQKDNGISNQIWGYAKTEDDYGSLLIRPITKMDKLISHFFSSGIKLKINKEFDDKYYIASTNSSKAEYLNKEFIDLAAKCNNLYIYLNKKQLLIGFLDESITPNQVLYFCKLLSSMNFIEKPT